MTPSRRLISSAQGKASKVHPQTSGVDDHHKDITIQEEDDYFEPLVEQLAEDYFTQENEAPKWRAFNIPADHVLFLGCSDNDDLSIRVMPQAQALQEARRMASCNNNNGDDSCCIPQPASVGSTLSFYDRGPFFHAIFWSLPGEEIFVPVKLQRGISPEEMETVPAEETRKAFKLTADEVVLYRPFTDRSEVHILARDAMEFAPISSREKAAKALQPLIIHGFVYAKD